MHNAVKPALARPFGAAFPTVSPDTVRAFTLSARIKRLLAMIATLFRVISRGGNEIERPTRVSLLAALLMRNYYRSVKKKLIESFLYRGLATRLKPDERSIDRNRVITKERSSARTRFIGRLRRNNLFLSGEDPGVVRSNYIRSAIEPADNFIRIDNMYFDVISDLIGFSIYLPSQRSSCASPRKTNKFNCYPDRD